ncbi:MAG: Gfo/Idh/MocA family oxidoreductase [Cyanothece sp. SIO2G6]|nr:Gfo/Idh/MocA family oxidoreductase [Cyanothece sp. SIO2G6]
MQARAIGIAVIGAGRWGNHLVRNFSQHPDAHLVALVDSQRERLEQLTHKYGLAANGVVVTREWMTVIQRSDVDAVAIATPASTHADLIRSALEHDKHVLVEKPITLDAHQALELCDLAQSVQRQLVVDHTYLFNAAITKGQQIVQQRQLGTPRYGYATRTHLAPVRHDVDALWDLAIHDISIFCHWLNAYPTTVQAKGKVWLQPGQPEDRGGEAIAPLFPNGLSDLVWVTLTYPNNIQITLHLCWANPDKQRRLCLVGDKGTLVFDELRADAPLVLNAGAFERHASPSGTHFEPIQPSTQTIVLEPVEPLRHVCDHFLDCVRRNRPSNLSSGQLGAKFVAILTAISESLNQGGIPITIPNRPVRKLR